jgi:serine/threonine protein kinase
VFGGLEIVRRLSEGASAEVLLARPKGARQQVIVELLRPELFVESELTTRFLVEARLRRALQHPNVARRVDERTADDGRPYLVSEGVGESLGDVLREHGPLCAQDALKLALPLCDALHYLHLRGLVHGNLEPAAVYLPEGRKLHAPKLLDYGLALFRPGRTFPRPRGRVLVRAEYLCPERVKGQRGTASSDLYALGVVLYEALAGRPPFFGSDPAAVRLQHLHDAPAPLPDHAAHLWPILQRCLAKDPRARFGSALELREALALELEGTLPVSPAAHGGGTPDTAPAVGEVVGRYELVEPLGEGAMGRVFLARHVRLGRLVALKLLKPEHAHDRAQVERFVREARAVNRIRNEHIVEVFDLVDESTPHGTRRLYCVMELLRGKSLGDLLREGPVPLPRALHVLAQVARALDAAHREGVVHRDVKPDNIFVTHRDGADLAKVVDFGVAKLRGSTDLAPGPGPAPAQDELGLTAAGVVVGTPSYMSPEQVTGVAADARTDVYGLGAVLYKVITGGTPFSGSDFSELCRRITAQRPAPLPEQARGGEIVPAALATLVAQCLEKDPGLRPQSMAEVATRLDAARAALVDPEPRRAGGGKRRVALAVLAAAVATALGLAALAAS